VRIIADSFLIGVVFGSFASAVTPKYIHRAILILAGIATSALLLYFEIKQPLVLAVILLPTLIHVYGFTGIFMIVGLRRTPTLFGALSVLAYFSAPFVLLYLVKTPASYVINPELGEAALPFTSLLTMLGPIINVPVDLAGVYAFTSLLAFAYTYHYLNWFSKAEVIKWHKIPKKRLLVIAIVYSLCLTLYFVDVRLGFVAFLALGLAHVMLELPLNVLSFLELTRIRRSNPISS
jgi:hypothetical protein